MCVSVFFYSVPRKTHLQRHFVTTHDRYVNIKLSNRVYWDSLMLLFVDFFLVFGTASLWEAGGEF